MARIVSLVPSITELVCDLGLSHRLVGRTGFCIHPWATVRHIPKVGRHQGRDAWTACASSSRRTRSSTSTRTSARPPSSWPSSCPHVIVTHPQAPRDNLALYRLLGAIFDREAEAERLCWEFEAALEELRAAEHVPLDVLYLIWRDPWMTVAPETYIAQTLA